MNRSLLILSLLALSAFASTTAEARPSKSSMAADPYSEEATDTAKKANKKATEKQGAINASILNPSGRTAGSRIDLNSSLSYAARQDVAQPREPRSTTHRLAAMMAVTILDRPVIKGFDDEFAEELVTLAASINGQMSTIGNEIQSSTQGTTSELSDVDFSASKSIPTRSVLGARSTVETSVGMSLPTSEASQFERIRAVPYVASSWILSFKGGRYGLTQGLSADYTMHEYEFSPVSREINSDSSAGYSLSASARLGAGFRFSVGGSARLVHYFDQTTTAALANTQTLSWTQKRFTVSFTHSNGSRAEDRQSSMWFVDEYRRVFSLGLTARF